MEVGERGMMRKMQCPLAADKGGTPPTLHLTSTVRDYELNCFKHDSEIENYTDGHVITTYEEAVWSPSSYLRFRK
jgi:hypothetical protein